MTWLAIILQYFFIQDAVKFPDLIHAVANCTTKYRRRLAPMILFGILFLLMPESTTMIMWAMSDRALPRSLRMMEGFGIHTFRLVNESNQVVFVKFHLKPVLGVHSVAWDEKRKRFPEKTPTFIEGIYGKP